jgi:hypothetical protein
MAKKQTLFDVESLNNVVIEDTERAAAIAAALPKLGDDGTAYAIIDCGRPGSAQEVGSAVTKAYRKGYRVLLRYRLWDSDKEYGNVACNNEQGSLAAAGVLAMRLKEIANNLGPGVVVGALILGSDQWDISYPKFHKPPERVIEQVFHSGRVRFPSFGAEDFKLVMWLPYFESVDPHIIYRNKSYLYLSSPDACVTQLALLQKLDKYLEDNDLDDFTPILIVEVCSYLDDKPEVGTINAMAWLALCCTPELGVITVLNLKKVKGQGNTQLLTDKHYRLIDEALSTALNHEEVVTSLGEPMEVLKLVGHTEGEDEIFLLLVNFLSEDLELVPEGYGAAGEYFYEIDLVDLEPYEIEASGPAEATVVRRSHDSIVVDEDTKTVTLPPNSFAVLRLFSPGIRIANHEYMEGE